MTDTNNKLEIETLVRQIVDLQTNTDKAMERDIATPKLMRQLYKKLGKPDISQYPDIYNHIRYADRVHGYTKYPRVLTKDIMNYANGELRKRINKMSETKERIVDSYQKDGWSATVYAFNVICSKYVPHKDYDNVWIEFVSSRDTSRYEYILVKED